jgi:hypothetical protein
MAYIGALASKIGEKLTFASLTMDFGIAFPAIEPKIEGG